MTRILISGAAGMVGRAMIDALPHGDIIATDLAESGPPDGVKFQRWM